MEQPARVGNRRGQRSKEEILEVAARLMAERGYAATSLSVLSSETGLPKSAIYHHFRSKGGLLSAVMARGAYDFFQAMTSLESSVPRDGSVRDRLDWILQSVGEVFTARKDFLRLHMLLLMSTESADDVDDVEVGEMLLTVRSDGRTQMVRMLRIAFESYGEETAARLADQLVYFAIAGFDGAFIAAQAEPERTMASSLHQLADALAALAEQLAGQRS